MKTSLAFHIVGLTLWVGGLVIIPRIMKGIKGETPESVLLGNAIRRVFLGFVVSGFVISLLTGIFQLETNGGPAVYMKQGWFHGKLTFVCLLVLATALLWGEVVKLKKGRPLSAKKLIAIHAISALSLIAIPFLTFLGR